MSKIKTDRKRRNPFGKLSNVLSQTLLRKLIDLIIFLPSPASIQYSSTNMYPSTEYFECFDFRAMKKRDKG